MFRILHPRRYRKMVQARRDQEHIFGRMHWHVAE
jgi:hypothetical protein